MSLDFAECDRARLARDAAYDGRFYTGVRTTGIRRYHLKGLVGARILDRLLKLGWLKSMSGSRAIQLTSSGRADLSEMFQIEINDEGVPTGRLFDPRRLTA